MPKETAVQWLERQFTLDWDSTPQEMFNAAKDREQQQILEAYRKGFTEGVCFGSSPVLYKQITSEQYYQETYFPASKDWVDK